MGGTKTHAHAHAFGAVAAFAVVAVACSASAAYRPGSTSTSAGTWVALAGPKHLVTTARNAMALTAQAGGSNLLGLGDRKQPLQRAS